MFARLVTTHVKPGNFDLLTRKFEEKVIPMLKNQPGFRDEVTFYDKDKGESFAIWMASSMSRARKSSAIGPNISSRYAGESGLMLVSTPGAK